MIANRRPSRIALLLALGALGCEGRQPLEPGPSVSAASSGSSAPAAPSGLGAAAASTSQIDLSWSDNATNESGFEVYRSTTGAYGMFFLLTTTGANATSYSDAGLASSTQYCYKVRAFRVSRRTTSYSTFSATACDTTLAPPPPSGPPEPPSYAYAGASGSHGVAVQWDDNSTTEDGFRLDRSTDGGASWVTAGTTAANITSSSDVDLVTESVVCYRVLAFNSQGDSPPSNTSCATLIAGPTDMTTDSLGNLNWTDNSALEDGYEVWMMDASGPAYDGLLATLPANSTSFSTGISVEDCRATWCHGFAVVAIKDGGSSDWAWVVLVNMVTAAPRRIP
jgi:hypothetical protein